MPMNWRKVQLSGIGSIVSGATPKTSEPENWNGEIVWLTPEDLSKRKKYYDSSTRYISRVGLRSSSAKLIPPHSVVISSRAPVGYLGIPTVPYATNQGCKSLVPSREFNSEFVYYALHNCVPDMMRLGSGTTFTEISRSQLESLKVSVPNDINEQIAIAAVLSRCDATIHWTLSVIKKLQRIKQGLMQDLLTKGIDKHGNIRSEKTHKFKDSPLGRIPVEWDSVPIGSFARVRRGASPRPIDDPKYFAEGGRGWIRIADVTNSYKYLKTTHQYLSPLGESKSVPVNRGDLIMSICATIGVPIIIDTPSCIHDGFVQLLNYGSTAATEFLFYLLDYNTARLRSINQTGTQGNLNTGIVKSFPVRIPTEMNEQLTIASRLADIDASIEAESHVFKKLTSVKRGLMQDLLSGKVRVTPLMRKV